MITITNLTKIVMLATLLCGTTSAQEIGRLRADQQRKQADTVAQLQVLVEATAKIPKRIEPGQWANTRTAAVELKRAVTETIAARKSLLDSVNGLAADQGRLRDQVAQIQRLTLDLEGQARREIQAADGAEPLPSLLQSLVQQEADGYAASAADVNKLDTIWGSILSTHRGELETIRRADGMLRRLDQHADNFTKLAELGVQVEEISTQLSQVAEGLNRIIQLFEKLNSSARTAVNTTQPGKSQATVTPPHKPVAPNQEPVSIPRTAAILPPTLNRLASNQQAQQQRTFSAVQKTASPISFNR